MQTKRCSKCGEEKPEIAFSLRLGKPASHCRECDRRRNHEDWIHRKALGKPHISQGIKIKLELDPEGV